MISRGDTLAIIVDGPNLPSKTAVIVFHGMGDQRQYETLSTVAESLDAEVQGKASAFIASGPGDLRVVSCATLTVVDEAVDLFEAYWSPWTKGKVSSPQVLRFLFGAAASGMSSYLFNSATFNRHLFGESRTFKIPLSTPLLLSWISLFLISIICVAIGYSWVGLAYALMIGGLRIFDQCLLRDLRTWLFLSTVLAVMCLGIFAIVAWLRVSTSRSMLKGRLLYLLLFCFMALQPLTCAMLGLSLRSHWTGHENRPSPALVSHTCSIVSLDPNLERIFQVAYIRSLLYPVSDNLSIAWILISLMSLAVALGYLVIPKILTTFLGDLVAYLVASHANEFYSLREEIRRRCYALCRDVMERKDRTGKLQYENIIVVSHSLGTVIAFDTINRILAEDRELGGSDSRYSRFGGLLTFGSPLNKAAFLFGYESQDRVDLRTSIMTCLQPLISEPAIRESMPWINFWSKLDPVSAAISYYDPSDNWPWRVINVHDSQASVPVLAHITYWQNPDFKEMLKLMCRSRLLGSLAIRSRASELGEASRRL